jgi:hypothetical protein
MTRKTGAEASSAAPKRTITIERSYKAPVEDVWAL